MLQILIYLVFLLVGAALAYSLFNARLKKVSIDLNQRFEKVKTALSLNPAKLEKREDGKGAFDQLVALGAKIESFQNIKVPEASQKPIENETKQKAEDLKQRYDNLQIVNELGQRVTSSLKLEDTFQHLYKTINSIMDAAVVELGVYYRRENRWKILSNLNMTDNQKDQDEEYKNHMAEWCLQNNREIFLNDAETEYSRYVFKPLVLPDGRAAQSVMSFPIFRLDKECGTITIVSFRPNAFNEYHVEMIRSLLPYTAVSLENAIVHEELITTQDQLIQKEKMASIGQLVSGIAHEILNPLNFVNNFSKLSMDLIDEIQPTLPAEEQIELKTQLVGNLDKINFHGTRAYDIVKSMMMLSRSGAGETDTVDVNNSVKEFLNISYQGFKLKSKDFECKIENSLDEKLPATEMIPQDFGRVLINVFNNAFYAMNDKKKKIMQSKNGAAESYTPVLNIKTAIQNSRIVVAINDNGTGIPDEIKNKVFLPFFTTKPPGEGTGLGLSLSHDIIVKGNRGDLTFKSELGNWTEFRIEIPVVKKGQQQVA
jgi:signal transduction histidine kinase